MEINDQLAKQLLTAEIGSNELLLEPKEIQGVIR